MAAPFEHFPAIAETTSGQIVPVGQNEWSR